MAVPDLRKAVLWAMTLMSATSAHSVFPVVDPATQTARDATRRQILEAELATEKNALTTSQKSLSEAPAGQRPALQIEVNQHTQNAALINGELLSIGSPAVVKAPRKISLTTPAAMDASVETSVVPFWDVYRRPKADMPEVLELLNAADSTVVTD